MSRPSIVFVPATRRARILVRRAKGHTRRNCRQTQQEINAGLVDPTLKASSPDLGATAIALSPADFGKLIAEETEKWPR